MIAGMPGNRPAPPAEDGKPALRPPAGRQVNGQWVFSTRKIYNEGSAKWQYKGGVNPAW